MNYIAEYIAEIYARCEEVGDCLEWQGALSSGRNPSVRMLNALPRSPGMTRSATSVTSVLWQYEHGCFEPGRVVFQTCRNMRCVKLDHLKVMTRRQMRMRLKAEGVFKVDAVRKEKLKRIGRAKAKLTPEAVAEIKARTDISARKFAEQLSISKSTVERIRSGLIWRDDTMNNSVFNWRPGA